MQYSDSPLAGSSDHGELNFLCKSPGGLSKFNPSVVRSIPIASDVRFGSFPLITLNKPNKPNLSGVCVPCMDLRPWSLYDWLIADICCKRSWEWLCGCWYCWISWSYGPMPDAGFWELNALKPMLGLFWTWKIAMKGIIQRNYIEKSSTSRIIQNWILTWAAYLRLIGSMWRGKQIRAI